MVFCQPASRSSQPATAAVPEASFAEKLPLADMEAVTVCRQVIPRITQSMYDEMH